MTYYVYGTGIGNAFITNDEKISMRSLVFDTHASEIYYWFLDEFYEEIIEGADVNMIGGDDFSSEDEAKLCKDLCITFVGNYDTREEADLAVKAWEDEIQYQINKSLGYYDDDIYYDDDYDDDDDYYDDIYYDDDYDDDDDEEDC